MRGSLRTARLLLRPFQPGDVDEACRYRNDPEFARYLPHIPQPFTRRDAEEFVRVNIEEPWEKFPTFAVVLEGKLIGTVNLAIDANNQIAMLGYAISREHWGQGIATEAARAAVAWGFRTFGLAKIWASTDARNVASRRVMEKLGMQLEGLFRSHAVGRDGRTDSVTYGLLREEWTSSQSNAAEVDSR